MVQPAFSIGQPKVMTDVLKWEVNPGFSREAATLLAGSGSERKIQIGEVLGRVSIAGASAAIAAVAGNTGNGTAAMHSTKTGTGVVGGAYQAICIEPGTNAGTFEVFDPFGVSVGTAFVGSLFDGPVKFTISDGATDFVAGDAFKITVPGGTGQVAAIDFAAIDGRAEAWDIALHAAAAPDGADLPNGALVLRRMGIVVVDTLVWPSGATTDQKNAAIAQLEKLGILVKPAY